MRKKVKGKNLNFWGEWRILSIFLCLGVLFAASNGCTPKKMTKPKGELRIYNWHDYTPQTIIDLFQKETGVKVILNGYDGNEELLETLRKGSVNYDIVVPTHNFVDNLVAEGLIQKVNIASLPNFKFIEKRFREPFWDPQDEYTVPYAIGSTSFTYRSALVDISSSSYRELFQPNEQVCGKISMFSEAEEVFDMAHIYLGQEICSENPKEIAAVEELLIKQSKCVATYASNGINKLLADKEVSMAMFWDGDVYRGMTDFSMADLKYVYPSEGLLSWTDTLAVPTNALNIDAARYFINYTLQPKNAALISNFTGFDNAVSESKQYLDKEIKGSPSFQVPKEQSIVFSKPCSSELIDKQKNLYEKLIADHTVKKNAGKN